MDRWMDVKGMDEWMARWMEVGRDGSIDGWME